MFLEVFLISVAIILVYVYANGQYNESYWRKRGVKFHPRNKIFGAAWDYVLGKRAFFEIYGDLYQEYKNEPAVGFGSLFTPHLFIPNADNCSHILQYDASSFNHRGIESFEGDQLSENITFLNGPKWKIMRRTMTPLFTSTKLKQMYYIMDKSAQDFVAFIKEDSKRHNGGAFETMSYFCSAAITASVFGIQNESIFNSPFVKIAQAATAPTTAMNIKFALAGLSTRLTKLFRLKVFTEHEKFFVGAMEKVLSERKKENVQRHDFADLALNIQKNGTLKDAATGCEMEPTVGLLSAQAFFFFIAGVEPSATSMFTTLIELGVNPEILQKVHEEIDEAFEKHNNNINYDVIAEMNYLEKVLSEGLRKFPPVGTLKRQCTQDTVLPVGNIKVTKGTKIVVSIYDIQRDPRHYPDPKKFDPERFSKDGQQPINDAFYMPFGRGQRVCIGSRFARIQIKAGLVHLLRHFTVETIDYDKLTFKKELFAVRPINVDVRFIPRKNIV